MGHADCGGPRRFTPVEVKSSSLRFLTHHIAAPNRAFFVASSFLTRPSSLRLNTKKEATQIVVSIASDLRIIVPFYCNKDTQLFALATNLKTAAVNLKKKEPF